MKTRMLLLGAVVTILMGLALPGYGEKGNWSSDFSSLDFVASGSAVGMGLTGEYQHPWLQDGKLFHSAYEAGLEDDFVMNEAMYYFSVSGRYRFTVQCDIEYTDSIGSGYFLKWYDDTGQVESDTLFDGKLLTSSALIDVTLDSLIDLQLSFFTPTYQAVSVDNMKIQFESISDLAPKQSLPHAPELPGYVILGLACMMCGFITMRKRRI